MGENDIGFNYYMYPTLHRMALSPARLKFCLGPAGSAKTSGIIWTLLLQAIMQEPAADGVRYSRALVHVILTQCYARLLYRHLRQWWVT